MWNLPGPRLEPRSPALASRFLSTAPPGKANTVVWHGSSCVSWTSRWDEESRDSELGGIEEAWGCPGGGKEVSVEGEGRKRQETGVRKGLTCRAKGVALAVEVKQVTYRENNHLSHLLCIPGRFYINFCGRQKWPFFPSLKITESAFLQPKDIPACPAATEAADRCSR